MSSRRFCRDRKNRVAGRVKTHGLETSSGVRLRGEADKSGRTGGAKRARRRQSARVLAHVHRRPRSAV